MPSPVAIQPSRETTPPLSCTSGWVSSSYRNGTAAAEAGNTVRGLAERGVPRVGWDGVGAYREDHNAIQRHLDLVLSLPMLDRDAIRRCKFRVALDCVRGAERRLELGAQVGRHHEPLRSTNTASASLTPIVRSRAPTLSRNRPPNGARSSNCTRAPGLRPRVPR